MLTMSTDWISSHSSILSKISSVRILSSSITHPIWSLKIPNATYNFFGSLFQTRPSKWIVSKTLLEISSKSVSVSYTLMSNTTIDLATAFGFFALTSTFGFGLTGAGVLSSSSSPKRSSSLSAFLVYFFLSPCACDFSTHVFMRSFEKLLMK